MIQYELDPAHTTVGFSTKHLAVSTVRGHFQKFVGSFSGPDDDFTKVRGQAQIEVASITTNTEQRDNHLRSADFFDAATYPYATFELRDIEQLADDRFKVHGDLTIKATTRPITLDAVVEGRTADPFGGKERIGLTLTGKLDRMDFGLNWDGLAGAVPLAGHEVKLAIEAELVARAAELAKSA